jgi:hypothetical protein
MRSMRDDEVDGPHRGRNAAQHHAERVHVDVGPGVVFEARERHIIEPADIGRLPERKARIEEEASKQEYPVRKRVEARECHVARTQHKRPQVVGEARENRQRISVRRMPRLCRRSKKNR